VYPMEYISTYCKLIILFAADQSVPIQFSGQSGYNFTIGHKYIISLKFIPQRHPIGNYMYCRPWARTTFFRETGVGGGERKESISIDK
jgi:hypothetical protein